jgi:hypothetical protein
VGDLRLEMDAYPLPEVNANEAIDLYDPFFTGKGQPQIDRCTKA